MSNREMPAHDSELVEIAIALTTACNLRCRMCNQRGDKVRNPPRPASLSPEVVKRVVDEAVAANSRVGFFFWGGEPLLYPQLAEVCHYAKSRSAYVDINTNATMLRQQAITLVETGMDAIYVSLDGPTRETCDAIRGTGVYDKVIAGVTEFLRLRTALGLPIPEVHFVCTILASNYESLPAFPELCRSLHVDGLCVQLPVYVTNGWGEASVPLWNQAFHSSLSTWDTFANAHLCEGIIPAKLEASIIQLKERVQEFKLLITPYGYSPKQLSEYFIDEKWLAHINGVKCEKLFFRTNIHPNGAVTPCADFPDYVCGNVNDESIISIWRGEKYQQFRSMLTKALLPICYRCCELYDGRTAASISS